MAEQPKTLDHFPPEFVEKQRKRLEKLQRTLSRQQRRLAKYPDIGNSPDDSAQEASEFSDRVAIRDTVVVERLEKVEAAIARLDNGTYGFDLKTGQPIERGRLEAIPEAENAADSKL